MLVESLPSQVSIFVPAPPSTPVTMVIVLPELKNPFYAALASLLNHFTYNSISGFTNPDLGQTGDYIKPQIGRVAVTGTASPGTSIVVTVNGVNQSPAASIVADASGNWSTTVVLGPGTSTVKAAAA